MSKLLLLKVKIRRIYSCLRNWQTLPKISVADENLRERTCFSAGRHYLGENRIYGGISPDRSIEELRISSDKAVYFPKRDVRFYFVEITTGATRHIQQIHIDEPYLYPCRPAP